MQRECYCLKTDLKILEDYFLEWDEIIPINKINSIKYEKDHIQAILVPIQNCVLTEDKKTIVSLVNKIIETNPKIKWEVTH